MSGADGADLMELKPAAEEAETGEMVRGILALQARTAVEESRTLRRGVHAKGVCVRAVFEVLDVAEGRHPALAARLARGIYVRPGSYPATVRFSSSSSNVNGDWTPDVRGMAFSAELAPSGSNPGIRQDYSLQSAPTFPFNDARTLAVCTKVLTAPSPAVALGSLRFREQLMFARTMVEVAQQKRQPVRPYQQLRYWSATPFRHGSEDIVKYMASPAASNGARPLEKRNPDALRIELVRHLNEDATMSSFDFGLQFLDPGCMTYQGKRRDASFWIENAAVEWPEEQAPFHTVARLTLLAKAKLSAEACEAACIDISRNSTPDSAPIGGVNRARSHAVTASRNARLGRSQHVEDSGMRGGA
jgi:hypothetical protein